MVYVEFVYPPGSVNVIAGVEMGAVPRVAERIHIDSIDYRVYNVEWIYIKDNNECNPIINLVKDEVEKHIRKK